MTMFATGRFTGLRRVMGSLCRMLPPLCTGYQAWTLVAELTYEQKGLCVIRWAVAAHRGPTQEVVFVET